jgi:hypothetical protein
MLFDNCAAQAQAHPCLGLGREKNGVKLAGHISGASAPPPGFQPALQMPPPHSGRSRSGRSGLPRCAPDCAAPARP